MIGLFIALIIALGASGTVVVSDSARPGDTLFGVDQAVEKLRINIAREDKKNELRVRFAEERVEEARQLEEEGKKINGPTESLSVEQKAEVTESVELALDLLTELDEDSEVQDSRLESLVAELSTYLDELPEDARVQVSDDRLRIKFDQGPEKIEIKNQGDDKTKIEVRTEEGRIRVEVKDGQIEIKTKMEEDKSGSSKEEIEVEAKILSDKTVVEVEVGDEKTTFATSANTREGIITAIVAKFPNLSAEQVEAVLKLEIEDGENSDDDSGKDDDSQDDEDEDENEDEDEDENDNEDDDSENEDRSGSNSGSN